MRKIQTKALFTDLGGVLLTNGWDRESRAKAVDLFGLDAKEFEGRHQLLFGDYETGKITLDTYLQYAVFYEPRPFTRAVFIDFMYAQSAPHPAMIDLFKRLKSEHGLKVVAISNEGRELTEHRIKAFDLKSLIDFFVVSCFIGIKKPDTRIYHIALDLAQVLPSEVVYFDDRKLFVELAASIGMRAIHHRDIASTEKALVLTG